MFFIKSDPKDDVYRNLIDLAFDVCNEFILVVRESSSLYMNEYGKVVLEELAGSLKEVKKECEWPGTASAPTASVYYYNTDDNARKIIREATNSLHSWVHPDLPEDLSFIKNGIPWLINTSHEHESSIKTENNDEIYRIITIGGIDLSPLTVSD